MGGVGAGRPFPIPAAWADGGRVGPAARRLRATGKLAGKISVGLAGCSGGQRPIRATRRGAGRDQIKRRAGVGVGSHVAPEWGKWRRGRQKCASVASGDGTANGVKQSALHAGNLDRQNPRGISSRRLGEQSACRPAERSPARRERRPRPGGFGRKSAPVDSFLPATRILG